MNSFVLILVFLAPQGSGSGTAAMQMEFQNQQSCESFRDRVVAQWDGGVDAKRNVATRPRAYGLCVEKRPWATEFRRAGQDAHELPPPPENSNRTDRMLWCTIAQGRARVAFIPSGQFAELQAAYAMSDADLWRTVSHREKAAEQTNDGGPTWEPYRPDSAGSTAVTFAIATPDIWAMHS